MERILVEGNSPSKYFAQLYATGDTFIRKEEEVGNDNSDIPKADRISISIQKMTKQRERLYAISKEVETPGFKLLEMSLMDRVRYLEQVSIWSALDKGDKALIDSIRAEHTGIIMFFNSFKDIYKTIEHLNEAINDIQQDNPVEEKINHYTKD